MKYAEASITTKPSDAERDDLEDRAGHEDRDADDEDEDADDHLPTCLLAQPGAAQRRGELGVFRDERALHLLQQTQLLF